LQQIWQPFVADLAGGESSLQQVWLEAEIPLGHF
jgi:hypothetical protein